MTDNGLQYCETAQLYGWELGGKEVRSVGGSSHNDADVCRSSQ